MSWQDRPRSRGASGLACIMDGMGPAMVMIHEAGQRAEAWNAVMPLLSGTRRLIAVDLPGHGESLPLPEEHATLGDLVTCTIGFLQPFGRPLPVVGHGLGAAIAVELALGRPDLVSSVVALNPVFAPEAPSAAKRAMPSAESPAEGLKPALNAACHAWSNGTEPTSLVTARALAASYPGPDPDALARLHCPALFLTGSADPFATPSMSEALAATAPDGRAVIIDGGGQMVHMTHPGPTAAAVLGQLGAGVAI